ncbi:MAG: acyl-CoA dehydrogenase family protein [Chitinophagales bacterium]
MKNKVLSDNFRRSQNFFESDKMLQHLIKKDISEQGSSYMLDKWQTLGKKAATEMDELSLTADKKTPELRKRNFYGETLNEIVFHPAYHTLTDIAIQSEMFAVKWQPDLRQKFVSERHRLGFVTTFLYDLGEGGLPCPLCMTDGVALLIDRYCTEADKVRLLPHIYSKKLNNFYTGAMFLTEKAGGSDVGANLVSATKHKDDYYLLNGEKWFCSNANAEIIFALARTNPDIKSTKGLSIFLIEKQRPDGTKNEMNIVRLKDKLGVRSMASAECILTDTYGKLVGKEGEGFYIMADMINLSRLYNSIVATAFMRRALIESYQFLSFRISFGKNALNHALIRKKLEEIGSMYIANFYMTFKAVKLLDKADNGDRKSAEILRLLTPMLKKCTAEIGVYVIRESMELMGGMGYIEDGVLPKLMRDSMVLPIWEGAGNIMLLDMLRASVKSKGFQLLCEEIKGIFESEEQAKHLLKTVEQLEKMLQKSFEMQDKETLELTAKFVFEELTSLYQIAVLLEYSDSESEKWINSAVSFLLEKQENKSFKMPKTLNKAAIKDLLAWEF